MYLKEKACEMYQKRKKYENPSKYKEPLLRTCTVHIELLFAS